MAHLCRPVDEVEVARRAAVPVSRAIPGQPTDLRPVPVARRLGDEGAIGVRRCAIWPPRSRRDGQWTGADRIRRALHRRRPRRVGALRLLLPDRLPARAAAGAAAADMRRARPRRRAGPVGPRGPHRDLVRDHGRPDRTGERAADAGRISSAAIWHPGRGASSPTWSGRARRRLYRPVGAARPAAWIDVDRPGVRLCRAQPSRDAARCCMSEKRRRAAVRGRTARPVPARGRRSPP